MIATKETELRVRILEAVAPLLVARAQGERTNMTDWAQKNADALEVLFRKAEHLASGPDQAG